LEISAIGLGAALRRSRDNSYGTPIEDSPANSIAAAGACGNTVDQQRLRAMRRPRGARENMQF